MSDTNDTQFTIPRDGYLTFDALTLKTFIKDRLNEKNLFTDQNYDGSYISTVNEIIAYTFHTLMFYLNKTSTESMFSESQLYENMNRIVKLLDYKPIGKQTSMVTFGLSGTEDLPIGMYTAPRYSYVTTGGVSYSTNADITVSKSTSSLQSFDDAVYNQMLYQGLYAEYPQYQAVGNANEIMYIAPGDNVMDHFNIDVYVYEASTGQWAQWARTTALS